jgi:lysophospholipase L1-like esterase
MVTLVVVLTLVSFAQANFRESPREGMSAKSSPAPSPAVTPTRPQTARRVGAGASGGANRPITVVGVGDSVTAGSNCACKAYVELYAADLAAERDLKTSAINMGVSSGGTSPQLLRSLTQPGAFRDQVAGADILLVTIGANDLYALVGTWHSGGCASSCYSPLIHSVGDNIELIVSAARAARPKHPATVLVTNYWNVFQDGDVGTAQNGVPFEIWSDILTRAENAQICDSAQRAGATCVDLYRPFKGDGSKNPTSLLAADGDHPNAAGHQLIASTVLAKTPLQIP